MAAQRRAQTEAHDRVFAMLVEAAIANKRCPQLHEIERSLELAGLPYGPAQNAVPDLARAGKIRIEVSNKNYRVVTICEGPHRGAHTLEPGNHRPYLVILPGGEKLYPKRAADRAVRRRERAA